jgi:hypothetical protein
LNSIDPFQGPTYSTKSRHSRRLALDSVYTRGTRHGLWTIEALDWTTGEARGHWVLGDSRFNTLGGGVHLDEEGRIVFGSIFGKTRILRAP